MEEDDRCLAETHYQLGVAYSLSLQYEESIESFKKAQTVMEARIKNLEKVSIRHEDRLSGNLAYVIV